MKPRRPGSGAYNPPGKVTETRIYGYAPDGTRHPWAVLRGVAGAAGPFTEERTVTYGQWRPDPKDSKAGRAVTEQRMQLPAWLGRRRAGDAPDEATRRARVVKGWAFKELTEETCEAIRAYLAGGPVPPGYEGMDRRTR